MPEFPNTRRLKYGKLPEKPPFQMWEEIETQIARQKLTEKEQTELWDCLFLSLSQIVDLLAYARENASQPFVYPMIVTAAHTGARRSELIRSEVSDIQDDTIVIRERKRVRGKLTTRRVPLSTKLRTVLTEWLEDHPGGTHTGVCGGKMPNGWGLFDMHGNVSEWCWDWCSYYAASPGADPRGPEEKATNRVYRGGSWNRTAWFCRSASRYGDTPDFRYNGLGFRVARGLSSE